MSTSTQNRPCGPVSVGVTEVRWPVRSPGRVGEGGEGGEGSGEEEEEDDEEWGAEEPP